jgi:chaperonin cofactor prefoldin
MKKLILLCLSSVLLVGCSDNISKKDYDAVNADYAEINEEFRLLTEDYEKLDKEYNDLQNTYAELESEKEALTNLYNDVVSKNNELYEEDSDTTILKAWGITSFGDNTECVKINKNSVQFNTVISEVSSDSISDFYKQLNDSLTNLALVVSIDGTENIYIKALDIKGFPVIEYYMVGDGSGGEIMISQKYYDVVTDTFNNMAHE